MALWAERLRMMADNASPIDTIFNFFLKKCFDAALKGDRQILLAEMQTGMQQQFKDHKFQVELWPNGWCKVSW